ncbi:MAG TPA: chemotaxis protein CheD [Granulicella sp.]|jgi:chemotaxis protein CheD|nr:chemotaxis protein CheD [Granulicella sp.]
MRQLIVGIGDCKLSSDPDCSLVTYGLGSCIGITLYDPVAKVGGMLHYMLPDSSINAEKARDRPFMYADTGIPLLLQQAYGLGAERRRLQVVAVGGAQLLDSNGVFNIGKRNHLAMQDIFQQAGILIHTEVVGGMDSRTIRLEISTGRLLMRGANGVEKILANPNSQEREGRACV